MNEDKRKDINEKMRKKTVHDCLCRSNERQLFYCRRNQKKEEGAVSGHGNISGTTRLLVANSKYTTNQSHGDAVTGVIRIRSRCTQRFCFEGKFLSLLPFLERICSTERLIILLLAVVT
jgi:hypothetical protein